SSDISSPSRRPLDLSPGEAGEGVPGPSVRSLGYGLGFGRPHKAHDSSLWRPTYHRAPGRVVGTLQDPCGRHDEPSFANQHLVMVALDAVFGSAAIRNRATRDVGAGLEKAAEPRSERGVGVWGRIGTGWHGEQQHR